jgi:hypothetical protein
LLFNALLLALGCASLPEPESEGARLYVRYCSVKGCHGPIMPQAGGRKYWDRQMDRMLDVMRNKNVPTPNAKEKKDILEYLHQHAQGAAKN